MSRGHIVMEVLLRVMLNDLVSSIDSNQLGNDNREIIQDLAI